MIPTPGSIRQLTALAHQGTALTQYAPPVPDIRGLQLLLAAGIGLAAIVTDVLAVRQRRAALAGLPLAVLFLSPAATAAKLGGIAGTMEFLLAATGYLALLSADGRSRLRAWGRVVTVWQHATDDERPLGAEVGQLAATGRRIGLAAVAVAVIAPLVLPAVQLLRQNHSGGHGTIVEVSLPDPVVQLQGLLTRHAVEPVLSYRTTAADPATQYLQVYVLNYDQGSNTWRMINPGRGVKVGTGLLPTPAEILAGTPEVTVTTNVTLDQITGFAWPVHFLPVPYWPAALRLHGSWQEDLATQMIYSGVTPLARLDYTVTSAEPDPGPTLLAAPQQVPASVARAYLGYSTPVTAQLQNLAAQIVRGQRSAYAKAVTLEHWFLTPGRFSYTLRPNLPGTPAGLLRFLTKSRRGYCQQFAFAMAVLARLVGIPARIVVGYTAGQRQANGTWRVTSADAHAWPELYFAGAGWLRFEPTPGGPAGQGTAVVPRYAGVAPTTPAGQSPASLPSAGPSPVPTQSLRNPANPHVKQPGSGTSGIVSRAGLPRDDWIALAGGAVALALVAMLPALLRARTRRKRWRTAIGVPGLAVAAWREISDTLVDYGLRYRPSDSPRAVARTILVTTGVHPQVQLAVSRITSAVEQAFYGPPLADDSGLADGRPVRGSGGTAQPVTAFRDDVVVIRHALGQNVSWSRRLRARLLPASTMRPVWRVARIVTGLIDESPELTELSFRKEQEALAALKTQREVEETRSLARR